MTKPDGVSGAIRVGYDWQVGKGVFGLGGEYNLGKYDGGLSGVYGDALGELGGDLNLEVEKAATIFARAGYAVNENLLAYGLLGYTWADVDGRASDGFETYSDSTDLDGVTVGIGAEYRFTNNWSGYAEYAYTDFGTVKDTEGNVEATMQQVKLGVNYRF
ncbi:outer membrane protein [Paracoccus sp. P2]|uniref:outer membrane protein n=1 Tax=Paracoccus sp. P2 TaxID=3248840 RepID=UPI00391F64BA